MALWSTRWVRFHLGDPRVEELFVEAMGIWFDELPVIPITQAKKIIPFNTTYWTGWPTADAYIHPPTWWQGNTEDHPQPATGTVKSKWMEPLAARPPAANREERP